MSLVTLSFIRSRVARTFNNEILKQVQNDVNFLVIFRRAICKKRNGKIMQTNLQNNDSDEIIVLLDGWGMDETPYTPLKSTKDILFVNDYSELEFDFDFSKYKRKILITFSAGVFMAGYLKDRLPKFDLTIAINGVLNPFDKTIGLPEEMFSRMENITFENALEFRRYLISDKSHLEKFNRFQPHRDLKSSQNELAALKKYFQNKVDYGFDKIIIGKDDKIIPYENQLIAWKKHNNIRTMEAGHFLIYNFNSFDEIINL